MPIYAERYGFEIFNQKQIKYHEEDYTVIDKNAYLKNEDYEIITKEGFLK